MRVPRVATGVTLREMRWWDIENVLALESELFPEDAWSEGMFWSELAHARGPYATRRYLVAEDQEAGTLVGYGGLAAVGGTGDIQTIGITAAHRGTGLGSRLLSALIRAATDHECTEVLLEVRVDNAPAQRLYERFGFTPVGIRRGYYQPGNVDALVMRLADPAAVPAPDAASVADALPDPAAPRGRGPAPAPDPESTETPAPEHPSDPSTPQGTESHG